MIPKCGDCRMCSEKLGGCAFWMTCREKTTPDALPKSFDYSGKERPQMVAAILCYIRGRAHKIEATPKHGHGEKLVWRNGYGPSIERES